MSHSLSIEAILLRVGLSFFFAAVVGCERAHKLHSAGLRTFILVSVASASAMMLDSYIAATWGAQAVSISAAAAIGIAIISSYSILYSSKNQIKGLTTSVALWFCSITGFIVGAGFYTAAFVNFVAMMCSLSLLPTVEAYLKDRSNHFVLHLELKERHDLQKFITTIRKLGLKIDDIESNPAYLNSGLSVFSMALTITDRKLKQFKTHAEIIEVLNTLDYVNYIEEIQ